MLKSMLPDPAVVPVVMVKVTGVLLITGPVGEMVARLAGFTSGVMNIVQSSYGLVIVKCTVALNPVRFKASGVNVGSIWARAAGTNKIAASAGAARKILVFMRLKYIGA